MTIGLLMVGPMIWQAATDQDPAQAGGLVGVFLGVCIAASRVMAIPQVNEWLARVGLSAQPPRTNAAVAPDDRSGIPPA